MRLNTIALADAGLPVDVLIRRGMIEWLSDCEWVDIEFDDVYGHFDSMSDAKLLRGVERHYDGGIDAFVMDGLYA